MGSESVENLAPIIKNQNSSSGMDHLENTKMAEELPQKSFETRRIFKSEKHHRRGDTVSIISEMKMEDKFTFVSTGGGATLDFL